VADVPLPGEGEAQSAQDGDGLGSPGDDPEPSDAGQPLAFGGCGREGPAERRRLSWGSALADVTQRSEAVGVGGFESPLLAVGLFRRAGAEVQYCVAGACLPRDHLVHPADVEPVAAGSALGELRGQAGHRDYQQGCRADDLAERGQRRAGQQGSGRDAERDVPDGVDRVDQ
jgi:hypothetical protein